MAVYAVEQLMAQTRKLAAEYYRTTKQSLPVSAELAKHDAMRLLDLRPLAEAISGVDAIDQNEKNIQIKSRVIFQEGKSGYRIGQLNMDLPWDSAVLVLYDKEYEPIEIYAASREEIDTAMERKANPNRQKRGAMSVAQFKAIAERVWACE
jgi:hypothetical protein